MFSHDTFLIMICRWRVDADDTSNDPGSNPRLTLEAIVIKDGPKFDSLPLETKNMLSSASGRAFYLWSTPATWHAEVPHCGLFTTPGLHIRGQGFPATDPMVRFPLLSAADRARRGGYMTGDQWEEYIAAPFPVCPENVVSYPLVVDVTTDPDFSRPSG